MHSVELRSHFCLGRLCERRRYSRTPKLATPLVTCSQRKVVTTPEENACFSYTCFLFDFLSFLYHIFTVNISSTFAKGSFINLVAGGGGVLVKASRNRHAGGSKTF